MGMTKRLRVIPSMIDEMKEVIIVIAVGLNEDISHRLTFMLNKWTCGVFKLKDDNMLLIIMGYLADTGE